MRATESLAFRIGHSTWFVRDIGQVLGILLRHFRQQDKLANLVQNARGETLVHQRLCAPFANGNALRKAGDSDTVFPQSRTIGCSWILELREYVHREN